MSSAAALATANARPPNASIYNGCWSGSAKRGPAAQDSVDPDWRAYSGWAQAPRSPRRDDEIHVMHGLERIHHPGPEARAFSRVDF